MYCLVTVLFLSNNGKKNTFPSLLETHMSCLLTIQMKSSTRPNTIKVPPGKGLAMPRLLPAGA